MKRRNDFILMFIEPAASAFYNEEPCRGEGYYCTPTSGGYCPGDTFLEGGCPTQPSDIMCCTSVPFDEPECDATGGNCLDDRMCHGGDQVSGLCPSQPDGVRCCVCESIKRSLLIIFYPDIIALICMQRVPTTHAAIAWHKLLLATSSRCTRLARSISRRITLIPTATAPMTAPQSTTTSRIPAMDMWPRGEQPAYSSYTKGKLIIHYSLQIFLRERPRRLHLSKA